jgi:hypothetical protein
VAELAFDCLGVEPDRYAVAPILLFRLRISETSGARVDAIALRCQIRIEPARRRYSPAEVERLADLFGEPSRWGESLKPMQLAYVDRMVPGFTGSVEVDLPVPCTYDLEVAWARYFASLDDGEIPLLLLFSGTVFTWGPQGFQVEQVPWHKETTLRMPVRTWRELVDLFWPGSAWLRVRRETLDALVRFKSARAIPTWDQTFERLLKEAGEASP